jgi:hypothetical protein
MIRKVIIVDDARDKLERVAVLKRCFVGIGSGQGRSIENTGLVDLWDGVGRGGGRRNGRMGMREGGGWRRLIRILKDSKGFLER